MEVNTEIKSVVSLPDRRFDCEILHPVFGWIPFTADQNDVAEHGRAIWAAISRQIPPDPQRDQHF